MTALSAAVIVLAVPAHAVEITDPEECSDSDGRWGMYGGHFQCNLSTLDGGRECSGSDECESVCITSNNDAVGTQTTGHCYDWSLTVETCMNYVEGGVVTGMKCIQD